MTARLIMKLRVASRIETTRSAIRLAFVHPRRPELPPWTPGAHVDIHLADGRVRQYSLCGDADDRSQYVVVVKREDRGRGGSLWIHRELTEGAIAAVSAPRNAFPLAEDAKAHVFIAGGIGVTPFAAMARALAAREKDFALHYCVKSVEQAPLLDELRQLCGSRLKLWRSDLGQRFDPGLLPAPAPGLHVYACGPSGLTEAVEAHLASAGWPEDQIHVERFAASFDPSVPPEPFEAVIASTGQVVLTPADRSLLEVLRENGVALPSSCGIGVCGACECGFSGTAIHRDKVLSLKKRQDRMTPCVSRARGRLTLDL